MMKEKYESLPLSELRQVAKARGLKGISTLRKEQLVERMLQEDEKEKTEKPERPDPEGHRIRYLHWFWANQRLTQVIVYYINHNLSILFFCKLRAANQVPNPAVRWHNEPHDPCLY